MQTVGVVQHLDGTRLPAVYPGGEHFECIHLRIINCRLLDELLQILESRDAADGFVAYRSHVIIDVMHLNRRLQACKD